MYSLGAAYDMTDLLYNTIVTLYMYLKKYAHFSKLGGAIMEKNLN